MQNLTSITQLPNKELVFAGPYSLKGDASVFDDILFPFTQARLGALNKPDFDYTNVGLLFPQNDAAEVIYLVGQLPHSYKQGSDIHPHIHWQQSANTAVTWKLAYKWFNIGAAVPANFTTIDAATGINAYVSGNLHQISAFPAITGTDKDISSILLMKVYREDNTTTGDVLGFQFDIHFEKDTLGSRTLFTK